jgi:glycosyltransferase involved in cell wall biosynthesis
VLPVEIRDAAIATRALAWSDRVQAGRPVRDIAPKPAPPVGAERRPIVNVVLVSHCDFTGNSALHVYAVASELYARGRSPVVVVPENAESVDDVGRPPFPVMTYREARAGALAFPDGRGPDLVHAFTPREIVRRLTVDLVRMYGCRYIVHLEDNEDAVVSAELGGVGVEALRRLPVPVLDRVIGPRRFNPLRGQRFVEHAAGVTVVVERLLELVPPHLPRAVVGAGFDEAVLSPRRPRDEVRAELRLSPGDVAIVYTGNIHRVNLEDVRSLYAAVAALRRDGQPVVLVRTGWSSPETVDLPQLGDGLRELGWVPRSAIPELLAAADVLVQPGGPGVFNDYRFPSKLPEFLAAGKPVVLPRTNVGLELRDGEDALVIERGDADEIRDAVVRLAADPGLRRRIGESGRAFALRELGWTRSVDRVEELYDEIAGAGRPSATAWLLDLDDPPVKLIALVPGPPREREVERAREHGIWGFCFPASRVADAKIDYPHCLDVRDERGAGQPLTAFADPGYLYAGGAPLVADQSTIEPLSASGDYDDHMRERLSDALPDQKWFRSIGFPEDTSDRAYYETWLRKLVLETALCAPVHEPFVFVDPSSAWTEPSRREAWLDATQAGLRAGLCQLYASERLSIGRRDLVDASRS